MEHTSSQITSNPDISIKQELCPTLTLETLHDGKIWAYTFGKRTRDVRYGSRYVIDLWVQSMKDHVKDMATDEGWYRLHDFSQTQQSLSPYFVARLSELARYRPDLHGHSAFVIPRNIFTTAMWNLSQRIRPRHIRVRLFFDRDDALHWLKGLLDTANATATVGSARTGN